MSEGFATRADAPQAARWAADRWGQLRCLAGFDETHDVRTFALAPRDGREDRRGA